MGWPFPYLDRHRRESLLMFVRNRDRPNRKPGGPLDRHPREEFFPISLPGRLGVVVTLVARDLLRADIKAQWTGCPRDLALVIDDWVS